MDLALHANATTTPRIPCYIQRSKKPVSELAMFIAHSALPMPRRTIALGCLFGPDTC
jgi:hypothetical protein